MGLRTVQEDDSRTLSCKWRTVLRGVCRQVRGCGGDDREDSGHSLGVNYVSGIGWVSPHFLTRFIGILSPRVAPDLAVLLSLPSKTKALPVFIQWTKKARLWGLIHLRSLTSSDLGWPLWCSLSFLPQLSGHAFWPSSPKVSSPRPKPFCVLVLFLQIPRSRLLLGLDLLVHGCFDFQTRREAARPTPELGRTRSQTPGCSPELYSSSCFWLVFIPWVRRRYFYCRSKGKTLKYPCCFKQPTLWEQLLHSQISARHLTFKNSRSVWSFLCPQACF